MKLNVLATFPNPNDPRSLKGGYKHVTQLLKLLSQEFRVNLIIASSGNWDIHLPYCNNISFASSKIIPLKWIKIASEIIRNCRPGDILIVYNPTLHTLPALFSKFIGCRIVVDYVDIPGTKIIKNPILRILDKFSEKFFLKFCNNYTTSSTAIKERIKKVNNKANILMYHGTVHHGKDARSKKDLEYKIDADNINIFYLGAMFKFSGVDRLIKAFNTVEKDNNIGLYLCGSGREKHTFEELAMRTDPKKIKFLQLSDEELYPFMKQMDILVLPYINSYRNRFNFPSKIIDYLWSGKAILATNVGQIPEILKNGENALIVEDDIESLRSGLETLIKDNELRNKLSENAKDYYKNNFTPNIVKEKVIRFLENIK